MRIPLSAPDITEVEIEAVTAVLRTPYLSRGKYLAEFERALATRVSAAYGVAVSSGTAGLHLAVRACGIGAGDEVITASFGFVAAANAILYEGAIPVFVDVDPVTLNIDPDKIEAAVTPRTRAILMVHIFGRPAPMDRILALARRHGLVVIEDACEALGAEQDGRSAGTFGACGVFGFYPNKQITTGEGGMIVTDDPTIAALCRSMRNHGRDEDTDPMQHDRLGYNYRLSELACALGVAQLGRLDAILEQRRAVAEKYDRRLAGHPDVTVPLMNAPQGGTSWFVYVVRLTPRFARGDRDAIAADMQRCGIGCGRYFAPLHLHPHLTRACGHTRGDFPIAESASDRTLALPFWGRITDREIDEVCETLVRLVAMRREHADIS